MLISCPFNVSCLSSSDSSLWILSFNATFSSVIFWAILAIHAQPTHVYAPHAAVVSAKLASQFGQYMPMPAYSFLLTILCLRVFHPSPLTQHTFLGKTSKKHDFFRELDSTTTYFVRASRRFSPSFYLPLKLKFNYFASSLKTFSTNGVFRFEYLNGENRRLSVSTAGSLTGIGWGGFVSNHFPGRLWRGFRCPHSSHDSLEISVFEKAEHPKSKPVAELT